MDEEGERNISFSEDLTNEITRHFPMVAVFTPELLLIDPEISNKSEEDRQEIFCEVCAKCDIVVSIGDISTLGEIVIHTAIAENIPVLIFEYFDTAAQKELAEKLKDIGVYD